MKLNYEAQKYCLDTSILIYPTVINKKTWGVEVNYRGKIIETDKTYNKVQLTDKIWELYEFFYNKRNDK